MWVLDFIIINIQLMCFAGFFLTDLLINALNLKTTRNLFFNKMGFAIVINLLISLVIWFLFSETCPGDALSRFLNPIFGLIISLVLSSVVLAALHYNYDLKLSQKSNSVVIVFYLTAIVYFYNSYSHFSFFTAKFYFLIDYFSDERKSQVSLMRILELAPFAILYFFDDLKNKIKYTPHFLVLICLSLSGMSIFELKKSTQYLTADEILKYSSKQGFSGREIPCATQQYDNLDFWVDCKKKISILDEMYSESLKQQNLEIAEIYMIEKTLARWSLLSKSSDNVLNEAYNLLDMLSLVEKNGRSDDIQNIKKILLEKTKHYNISSLELNKIISNGELVIYEGFQYWYLKMFFEVISSTTDKKKRDEVVKIISSFKWTNSFSSFNDSEVSAADYLQDERNKSSK